jgi:hypothetical protein
MAGFPRTEVGGISVPRLVCGSNWMLGFSHQTKAKDEFLKELFDTPARIADVVEVFARAGCNAFMSLPSEFVREALDEVEQRTGTEMIWFATPSYGEWGKPDTWKGQVELSKRLRAQAIICSDESDADVATYIQPYNAAGFLCHVETDWLQRIFSNAKKPVLTIKPLAAGRLHPMTGLEFVWRTIRECDLVTIGTMCSYEAEEVIEISLACLEGRQPNVDLQFTRSKRTVLAHQPPA